MRGDPYLWRERDGRREVSWRLWVLIWVAPVLFALAALWLVLEVMLFTAGAEKVEGEVVRVHAFDGWTPTEGRTTLYAPVLRYTWSDGQPTEASAGQSSANWNFPIGSRQAIWARQDRKDDVMLANFEAMWGVAAVIAGIGLVLCLSALWATARLRRWRAGARRG